MIANALTGFRVLISIALLFSPVFSPVFYMFYLIAGLSDMADGIIAEEGTPEKIFTNPEAERTRNFLNAVLES